LNNGSPHKKAIKGAGNGGVIPPVEHRFKKGVCYNPGGRPKGLSMTKELYKILKEDVDYKGKKIKMIELLVRAATSRAVKKSDLLTLQMWNRVDGPVQQEIEEEKKETMLEIFSDDDTKNIAEKLVARICQRSVKRKRVASDSNGDAREQ
jgi:hypothetical protein